MFFYFPDRPRNLINKKKHLLHPPNMYCNFIKKQLIFYQRKVLFCKALGELSVIKKPDGIILGHEEGDLYRSRKFN